MRTRVSHILRVIAVICIILGIVLLFIKQPIKCTNFSQQQLYSSKTYQHLASKGMATKALVSKVISEPDGPGTTRILVKYFDKYGNSKQTEIFYVKVSYNERELINILYNPLQTDIARIDPADETVLNWSAFGWLVVLGIILFGVGHRRHKISGGVE